MENHTRFDLNAAVENWRNELAGQPNLAPDDRRELETHLRDAIAGFQQRGLNDEESFWLARRRVGQPQQIGEEFVKANPAKVWRERMFWIVLFLFLVGTLNSVPWFIMVLFFPDVWAQMLVYTLYLSPLIIAILLGGGKMTRQFSSLIELIGGRFRLASAAIMLISIHCCLRYLGPILLNHKIIAENAKSWDVRILSHQNFYPALISQLLTETVVLLILTLLLIWFMPPQNQKTPKRA
jgi:hypothetical protein